MMEIGKGWVGARTAGRFNRVWSKLSRILTEKFGCEIVGDWQVGDFIRERGWVHSFTGDSSSQREVLVLETRALEQEERIAVIRLIDSVLPPFLDLLSQRAEIDDMHLRLSQDLGNHETSNVFSIFKNTKRTMSYESLLSEQSNVQNIWVDPKKTFSSLIPIFLECQSYGDTGKFALDIHEKTQNLAFVQFEDLDPTVVNSSEELLSMDLTTIYIPELLRLTEPQAMAMERCLEKTLLPFSNGPLFITGSLSPMIVLCEKSNASSNLLKRLSRIHLRLQDSYSNHQETGYIQFLLSSLDLYSPPPFSDKGH